MKIIAIHGKARSGKDELAKILCVTYGFTRIGFADKLKEYAIKYFLLKPEAVFDSKTKESRHILQAIGAMVRNHTSYVKEHLNKDINGVSGYPLWVEMIADKEFGIQPIDFKRTKSSIKNVFNGIQNFFQENIDYLINISKGKDKDIWVNIVLNEIQKEDNVYVISDLRFKNEKDILEKNGAKCIKILRVDNPEIETGVVHQSEVDLDYEHQWEFIIVNEHKDSWRNSLSLSASNLIRKLNNENMFSEIDKGKFKINIDEYK